MYIVRDLRFLTLLTVKTYGAIQELTLQKHFGRFEFRTKKLKI